MDMTYGICNLFHTNSKFAHWTTAFTTSSKTHSSEPGAGSISANMTWRPNRSQSRRFTCRKPFPRISLNLGSEYKMGRFLLICCMLLYSSLYVVTKTILPHVSALHILRLLFLPLALFCSNKSLDFFLEI